MMIRLTRCVLTLATGFALLGATSAAAQAPEPAWSAIGPAASTVLSLQSDPSQPSTMLAGTYFGGLYRSNDFGNSWQHVTTEFSTRSVFAIAYDPTVIGTIYIGTFQGGLYKSVDGGLSWVRKSNGLPVDSIQTIAVSPSDSRLVLAGASDGGIYRSTDYGATWTRTDDGSRDLRGQSIVFDPTRPGTAYVGTVGRGVFRSTDSGATWETFSSGLDAANVLSLRIDRPTGSQLYAATNDGIYKLTLGASLWRNITHNLQVPTINDILPHPLYPGLTLAASNWGVFVIVNDEAGEWLLWSDLPTGVLSADPTATIFHAAKLHGGLWATTDFARTWSRVDRGIQNLFVGAFAGIPIGTESVLFAGTDFGIHHTAPTGWVQVLEPNQTVFDIERHPTQPMTMFMGTETGGVWKSTDAGQTWKASGTGIVPRQVHAITETADGTTLLGGTSSGVYVSRDTGATWALTNTGTLSIALAAAADPFRDPIAYVGGSAGQVYRTGDAGRTFFAASNGLPAENIVGLEIAAWSTVYAVTETGSLYSSWDEGTSWQPTAIAVPDPIRAVKVDPHTPWILYGGTHGGGIWKTESAGIEWAQRNEGLGSPFVFSLAIDPRDPRVVYAGTPNGVYRTLNGATTWTAAGMLPPGAVTSLVLEVANPDIVYASVAGAGVYRSMDRGAAWTLVDQGLPASAAAYVVASSVGTPGRLYAGTSLRGIYASSNRGDNWSASSVGMSLFVRGLAIDPRTPTTMYAGSLGGGVFKSTDTGSSWVNTGLHEGNILKLAIDPLQPQNIYAATSEGVGVTRDGGATWTTLGQKAPFVHVLAVDPANPLVAYAGASGSNVLKTIDGGQTWSRVNTGLPPFAVHALAVGAGGIVWVSPERSGVFSSSNGGATWSKIPDGAMEAQMVASLATAGNVLYAATTGGGVFKSVAGAAWVASSNGLATPQLSHIVVNPANPSQLWASTFNATIFKSSNGGALWEWAGYGLSTSLVHAVTPDPSVAGRLFAATPDGVFVSTDGGVIWSASGLADVNVYSVTVAPGALFAATNAQGVFKSINGGASWTASNTGMTNLDVRSVGVGTGVLYAATVGGGVARSTDGGATWVGSTHADLVDSFVLAVVVNPITPTTIYAGTSGGGVLKSINSGVEWAAVNNGLEHLSVLSLVIDPVEPSTIYAGTSGGGVFVSFDAGASWKPLNNGLFNKIVTALELDLVDRHRLYAGTEGGGAFAIGVPTPPPATCTYAISPGFADIAAEGGTVRVNVTAPAQCRWSSLVHADWLTLTSGSGTGAGHVDVMIAANLPLDSRSGLVTIAGRPFVVVQTGTARSKRLTVQKTGHGFGIVQSDWPGVYCGDDCMEVFTDGLPVVLTAQPLAGFLFAGWSGDPDCADGAVTLTVNRVCTARFEMMGDGDLDGLPDSWENDFGLNPASAVGNDGAQGDPDQDGVANADEYLASTHPRGFFVRYFADGSTANGFETAFALGNVDAAAARVLLRFAKADGAPAAQYISLQPRSRGTINARDVPTLGSIEFATIVESDTTIVIDRRMSWGPGTSASHAETSGTAGTSWYLIGGAAPPGAGAELTYHLFNPGPTTSTVTATYTLTAGAPIVKTYTVNAGARRSIRVGEDDSRLAGVAVWTRLSASQPIVAEGSLLVDGGGPAGSGVGAAGIGAPATRWYLAEASTRSVFETDLLLVNPNTSAAAVRLEYLRADGTVVTKDHTVPPMGRLVVRASAEDPLLADAEFATVVTSTNDVSVLAQRTTMWPEMGSGTAYEAHTTNAVLATGTSWALADGEVAVTNWSLTYILIANTSATAGSARVQVLLEDGTTLTSTFALPARSRVTIPVAEAFPGALFKRFSAIIDSLGSSPAQIVVEHSMYSNSGDVIWAAGSSASAVRLAP